MLCETCKYYAEFEGVCCNADCFWRGGWPPWNLKECANYLEKLDTVEHKC